MEYNAALIGVQNEAAAAYGRLMVLMGGSGGVSLTSLPLKADCFEQQKHFSLSLLCLNALPSFMPYCFLIPMWDKI